MGSLPAGGRQRRDSAGGEDNIRNEVVRQFRSNPANRQIIGVLTSRGKPLGMFPNGVVARHEHDTAPLQDDNAVVLRRESALHRLEVGRVVGRRQRCEDEGVACDTAAGDVG